MRLIIILIFLFQLCQTYKVLVFNPAFGASHSNFLGKISDILIDAGNDVTMLIPVYMKSKSHLVGSKKVKNIFKIDLDPRAEEMLQYSQADELMRKKVWEPVSDLSLLIPILKNFTGAAGHQCEFIMQHSEILEKLKAEKFDLAISESIYLCGLVVFDQIGIKTTISVDSMVFQDIVKYSIGEPSSTSFYPNLVSPDSDDMSIFGRAKNMAGFLFSLYFGRWRYLSELEAINSTKTWFDYLDNVAYSMINSNPYIDYPSPILPKTVFIGGMQVTKSHKLEEKWDDVLNLRSKTILISFGTHAYSSDMPEKYKNQFLKIFEAMPDVTFIWKYEIENSTIVDHLPNVVLTTWMPQIDLLADERLSLFVTHGGLGSIIELAYSGKPAIVISLFGDQHRNAHMLTRHGGAIELQKNEIGIDNAIFNAIQKIQQDPIYEQNAKKLAKILESQPNSPKETVLKHCDFAVKFGSLDTIKSKGRFEKKKNKVITMCYPIEPPNDRKMGLDTSLLKSVLEQFVDEIGEESSDLIVDRPRFAHAVIVVADEENGEFCQASCIRQLDEIVLHETHVANVEAEWMDEEIQRALRELNESKDMLETPRNSVFVEETQTQTQKTSSRTTSSTKTSTTTTTSNLGTGSRYEFPSMSRARSTSAARRQRQFH
ncbi:unnamed protein product [Caenorhabditis angaria]|uniref:glucuronosyltransferase n=1 Tax=Caenorhabditis angaria TaxID=860376 RepID=A0A9P1N7P0_9PELO|nr:unnamed protein product [Caenorhabditis angaria]